MLTEYRTHEMVTLRKRKSRNALKFWTSGEVNSKEGGAQGEGLLDVLSNVSKVETPQVELDGAVGEALVLQPPLQHPRTKLIFDVRIDDPFSDWLRR